ncbi:MAG: hypothetical protein GY726_17595 [Proteobacteria bacterium]|nr:hypothetical protein [Pseudomonadota bacterium]
MAFKKPIEIGIEECCLKIVSKKGLKKFWCSFGFHVGAASSRDKNSTVLLKPGQDAPPTNILSPVFGEPRKLRH